VQDGAATKRKVTAGQRTIGSVQVTDGLQAGELVVIEGTQKLRDGAGVTLVDSPAAPKRAVATGATTGEASAR